MVAALAMDSASVDCRKRKVVSDIAGGNVGGKVSVSLAFGLA
jgi:hypothetical protein